MAKPCCERGATDRRALDVGVIVDDDDTCTVPPAGPRANDAAEAAPNENAGMGAAAGAKRAAAGDKPKLTSAPKR